MIKTYGQTPKQLFTKPHPMVSKLWTHERKVDNTEHVPRVLDNVVGLRWGNYVGSPAHPEPKVAWKEPQTGGRIARLVSVETNEVGSGTERRVLCASTEQIPLQVFGLPSDAAVAVHFSQDKNRVLAGAALLTFGHVDNVLRVRLKRSACSQPVRGLTSSEVITAMDVAPEGERLWIGYECGKIVAQSYAFNHKDLTFALDELDLISLFGHTSSVTCLSVCAPFGIVVSGSVDGSAIVWDMNNPSFVRQIGFGGPVSSLCVSRTSGDLVVVSGIPGDAANNQLSLFTINGSKVASELCEPAITAVAFSSSPEGVSVNVRKASRFPNVVKQLTAFASRSWPPDTNLAS
jgi:WD40 repeat protein